MRYLFVGDCHGDLSFASEMSKLAKNAGLGTTIFQCGDFGIWPGAEGKYYLDTLSKNLGNRGQRLVFADGNHEDFDQLEDYADDARVFNTYTEEGFIPIRDNIFWSPRGNKFELDGRSIMSVGGAVSIDRAWRTPHKSWWPQEQITQADLDKVENVGQADILFTHDCPSNAPFKYRLKPDFDSVIHRQIMDWVGHYVKPKVWFHGHMHSKYDYEFRHDDGFAHVIGLECNDSAMDPWIANVEKRSLVKPGRYKMYNYAVLNTDDLSVSWEV